MIHNKTSIIYLAHGPKHLHRQSIFSILTLCYYLQNDFSNINLVIYTDDKAIFEQYLEGVPLHFELLTPDQIKKFVKNDYVHRVKICVIQDCMRKYGTNTLFIDGDTYFLKSPVELINQISKDLTVFHLFELTIADGGDIHEVPIWLTLRRLAKRYEYIIRGERFKLDFNSQMWNSGVLGISKENYHLIDDVLSFNDQLTEKEYFKTAEQFAFSFVLKKYTRFIPADTFVYHYFLNDLKILFNYHIGNFLKDNLHAPLMEKASKAVLLSQRQDELKVPEKSFLERLKIRLELILKVAKDGHL